ncbi:MAG: hypothetical protein ACI837_003572 [Crocinitomicaceae bacterium]|jgi:hypothetical protein
MWKHKTVLWTFPVLAGMALGILVYSLDFWNTSIPDVYLGYWFGMSNFTIVFIATGVTLLVYTAFLIVRLLNKNSGKLLKIWMLIGMLASAGISEFTLSSTQAYQRSTDFRDSLNTELMKEHETH